jgi:hypothetical protein
MRRVCSVTSERRPENTTLTDVRVKRGDRVIQIIEDEKE